MRNIPVTDRSDTNKHDSNRLIDYRKSYSDDGVDLSLIRWMLSMTPAERLNTLQRHVRSILRLRDGIQGS